MKKASALLLLLLALLGCGGPLKEMDYSKALQTESAKGLDALQRIESTPWPKLTGLSKEERFKVLSERARQDGKTIETLAADLRGIKPPGKYAALHAAYQEFLDGLARIKKAYADAIAAGDSEQTAIKRAQYDEFMTSQSANVVQEAEKVGEAKFAEPFVKLSKKGN